VKTLFDWLQIMPKHGYTRMFERMLNHPNITIMLQADFRRVSALLPYRKLIFTGAIDEYFDRRLGRLPYRSLRFEHVTLEKEWHQPVAVVNYPGDEPYTRISEYKHLTGQNDRRRPVCIGLRGSGHHQHYAQRAGWASGELVDTIANIRLVKMFGTANDEHERLRGIFSDEAAAQPAAGPIWRRAAFSMTSSCGWLRRAYWGGPRFAGPRIDSAPATWCWSGH